MALQVELEPVVDGLPADARQPRDPADGGPLGHPQHGLHALEEAFISHALQRFLEPRAIVTIEAQFRWAFRDSHTSSVDSYNVFFKKLLLTHLGGKVDQGATHDAHCETHAPAPPARVPPSSRLRRPAEPCP